MAYAIHFYIALFLVVSWSHWRAAPYHFSVHACARAARRGFACVFDGKFQFDSCCVQYRFLVKSRITSDVFLEGHTQRPMPLHIVLAISCVGVHIGVGNGRNNPGVRFLWGGVGSAIWMVW